MAGRGGAGVGVVVTISILSILSLGLFISTIIFYGNLNKMRGELASAEQSLGEYINAQERQDPQIAVLAQAARDNRQTVVGYLHDSLRRAMETIEGSGRGTYDQMVGRLQNVNLPGVAQATGASGNPPLSELIRGTPMKQLLTQANDHISRLDSQLTDAQRSKQTAEADLTNELERVRNLMDSHEATLAQINEELAGYRAEVEAYRAGTQQAEGDMQTRLARLQQDYGNRETQLVDRINELEQESAQLREQLDKLRSAAKDELFQGSPEESLVDGRVIGADPAERTATIDLGRRDKIRVGMTFAVFEEASAIRPDESGSYPRGKASLEVIRIDDISATCRVIGERAGNPVVRGDVIANAVYDPSKVYTFLVFGNFDANRDGIATAGERAGVSATIEDWGGKVTDELTGAVDFLVLGARPTLPPEPPINAPIAIVEQYVQAQQVIARYDRLFEQAAATSIPILNENRLRTLIGGR